MPCAIVNGRGGGSEVPVQDTHHDVQGRRLLLSRARLQLATHSLSVLLCEISPML